MSDPIPLFFGTAKKGKFVPDSPDRHESFLRGLEDKRLTVKYERERKKRSLKQSNYLFGVVYKYVADHTGYTVEETHESMKFQFLRLPGMNGMPDTVRSTTSLSTAEMEEYLENIRRWAAVFLDTVIPLPGEVDMPEMYPI